MDDKKSWLKDRIGEYASSLLLNNDEIISALCDIASVIREVRNSNKTVYFAGNGASTTIASHAALDYTNQLAVKCHAMNDPNFITCFANDFGYDDFMSRTAKLYCGQDDVVILISSSGESPNVIAAAKTAREKGCKVITLSGFNSENALRTLGDINLWLDSTQYNVVECIHMIWLVMVCDLIVSEESDKVGLHGVNL